MVERGRRPILPFTRVAGARPTPGAPLCSSAWAAAKILANGLQQVVAGIVQDNAIGTNRTDLPGFLLRPNRAEHPGGAPGEGYGPGTMDDQVHLALRFVDGTSRVTTGPLVGFASGWV